jgi:hypothetical protein
MAQARGADIDAARTSIGLRACKRDASDAALRGFFFTLASTRLHW